MAGERPITKLLVGLGVLVWRRWRARKHGRHEKPDGRHVEPEG